MSAITVRAPAAIVRGRACRLGELPPTKPIGRHARGLGRGDSGDRILDHDALGGSDIELRSAASKTGRAPACLGRTWLAENRRGSKKRSRPVTSRLSECDRSATTMRRLWGRGSRSGMRGVGEWAQLGTQPPQRFGGDRAEKSGGKLLPVAASLGGQKCPPGAGRETAGHSSVAEDVIPTRLERLGEHGATIGSLSTSTPLQSKMTTGPPRCSGRLVAGQLSVRITAAKNIGRRSNAKTAAGHAKLCTGMDRACLRTGCNRPQR